MKTTKRSTDKRLDKALDLISEGRTVKSACKACRISTATLYQRIETDAAIKTRYDAALTTGHEIRYDELEGILDECWRQAPKDPRYQVSLFFALKAADPKKYCEKYQVANTSNFDYQDFIRKILGKNDENAT